MERDFLLGEVLLALYELHLLQRPTDDPVVLTSQLSLHRSVAAAHASPPLPTAASQQQQLTPPRPGKKSSGKAAPSGKSTPTPTLATSPRGNTSPRLDPAAAEPVSFRHSNSSNCRKAWTLSYLSVSGPSPPPISRRSRSVFRMPALTYPSPPMAC